MTEHLKIILYRGNGCLLKKKISFGTLFIGEAVYLQYSHLIPAPVDRTSVSA